MPPVASAQNNPTPDWRLLEEMSFGKPAFIVRVIDAFLREAPPLLERLVQAADAPALAATAHRLRGQVAYFGVPALHAALNEVEQLASAGQPPAEAILQHLGRQLRLLLPQLQAHRQVLTSATDRH